MVKSLDEVIERLQYKADNIKAKLEPSYFTECIDYLKTLPRVEEEQEIRNNVIDEFALSLKLKYPYFVEDVGFVEANKILNSVIDEIAEQMKGE
jgi:hypothetical protein